ncbi:MAG: hypothetical protein K2K36_08385 [Muribaculaceae bacterium]|nr:hypothetical protein [Muribaculaceae bacterium]
MKILAFDRELAAWSAEMAGALASDDLPAQAPAACAVITDSATLRPREPMFVPDFARGWQLMVAPALTVQRLGKWIAPRFASRYVGDFRLCVRLLPPDGAYPLGALETNFDGALAWGRPRPAEELRAGGFLTLSASLSADPAIQHELTLRWADMRFDETIALASRYMTLKTGDVIIPCRTPLLFPVLTGTRLCVTAAGDADPDINLKIK